MRIYFVAVAMAVSLSACASTYVGKPYDRAANNIQSIQIVDDSVPPKISAMEVASVGANFGLVGALANAAVTASREEALNAALTTTSFDAEARLEEHLVKALGDAGYKAAVEPGAVRAKRIFLTSYSSKEAKPDAHLDLVIVNYGYISAGAGQPWRPTVQATVRLVSASDNKVLMENQIVYNGMFTQNGVITLTPDPTYAFKNRDDMLADPSRLASGLETALNKVADTAVGLLR